MVRLRQASITAALIIFSRAALGQSTEEEKNVCASPAAECSTTVETIRLGLEWFTNPDHLPLIVAQKHGIFASFGLDVQLIEPSDHWEAEEEILAGRLDVAVTEPLHLAQDAAKGKPVLGFSRFLHTDGGVLYDAGRGDIKRPADMCGKTISYPGRWVNDELYTHDDICSSRAQCFWFLCMQYDVLINHLWTKHENKQHNNFSPGPGGPAIVNTMVKADGNLDCDISSYKKHNGSFFHTDALQSNAADVATLIFWNFEIPEAKAKGMKDAAFFSLKEWGVPDFCQLVLMTTPSHFDKRKDVLRKLVLAMRRATGIVHQQPDLAREYYYQHVSKEDASETQQAVIDATFTATLPAFPNDNMMSKEYYEHLMGWLVETDQVDSKAGEEVSVSSYWTNEISW